MPEEIISQSHGLPRKSVLHLLGTWELDMRQVSIIDSVAVCAPTFTALQWLGLGEFWVVRLSMSGIP